jgi:very-short-patch-repair endonuclease
MLRNRIDRGDYPDRVKLAIARQLRREPTPAERHAWALLRNRGILGLKFRRQHVLEGFIVRDHDTRKVGDSSPLSR